MYQHFLSEIKIQKLRNHEDFLTLFTENKHAINASCIGVYCYINYDAKINEKLKLWSLSYSSVFYGVIISAIDEKGLMCVCFVFTWAAEDRAESW